MIRRLRINLREHLRRVFAGRRPPRFAMDGEHKTRTIRWEDEDRPSRRDWWGRHEAERDRERGYSIPRWTRF